MNVYFTLKISIIYVLVKMSLYTAALRGQWADGDYRVKERRNCTEEKK